jgi:formate dehydrogenase maturation protein FdhE
MWLQRCLKCPVCGSPTVRESMLMGWFEHVVFYLGIRPYRCAPCDARWLWVRGAL